jgi:hypothetical protein
MKRTLKPFKGLDNIEFGMLKKKVQGVVNVKESEVTNKYLKEEKVVDGPVSYVFQNNILVMIEIDYHEGVYLNDVDIFTVKDINAFLKGFKTESRRDTIQIKELGLVLSDYGKKDVSKRYLILYSKEMIPTFEDYLEIV